MNDITSAAASYVSSGAGRASTSNSPSFDVSWSDIGGFKRVKRAILEVVRLPLLYHKLYRLSPVKMPRAILLYGPPGCGKTFVAQAAGREFGLDFISIRGPQLLDKYIGASEKAVRELFHRARNTGRPTLLFFDEFESLAPKRGKDNTGITDRIVNQLLTFIDGVESSMGGAPGGQGDGSAQVFLIAATSRPDLVDGALLRPGRIEKHIYIGLPSVEDRASILNMCLSKLSVDESASDAVQWIAAQEKTTDMTAADLKAVVSTAFLLAAHEIIDSGDSRPSVVLSALHLRCAFAQTRPSVSEQDRAFYAATYEKFKPNRERRTGQKDGQAISASEQKMSFR
jgi:peroxin-1